MFQVDNSTAAAVLPAPAAAGMQGYFTNGVPGGAPRTILEADYMNMLMMELINVVTAAGLTPSKTTYTQVRDAINLLVGTGTPGQQIGFASVESATQNDGTPLIPQDNTIPQNTEGTQLFTASITPKFATSLLEVTVVVPACGLDFVGAIFQDSAAGAIAAGQTSFNATGDAYATVDFGASMTIRKVIAAGSTAATTFKFRYSGRVGGSASGNRLGGAAVTTMTVREIKQ